MAGFDAGAGPGVAALGPLRDMWREVYRKAAEVSEARTVALLAEHVYQLHQPLALVFSVDGGGAELVAGGGLVGPAAELPRPVELLRWAVHADQVGTVGFDLRLSLPGALPGQPNAYPPTAADSLIGTGVPPQLGANPWNQSDDLTGWTSRLPQGAVVVPVLTDAAVVTLVTLSLRLRLL
jgi:hypothetical protein